MSFSVSVWSGYFRDLSIERAVEEFILAGFSCTELGGYHTKTLLERGNTEQVAGAVKAFLRDRDFRIPQGHLSFQKGFVDIEVADDIKKELDLYLALGIENAVLHFNGGYGLPEQERFDRRVGTIQLLCDHIKGCPIKLCLENLGPIVPEAYTVPDIRKIMAALDSDRLGICLDTGHLHWVTTKGLASQSQEEFILAAGEDLCAVHVADNDGKGDQHLMPFSSRNGIQWHPMVKALKQIDYKGLFDLELVGEMYAPMEIRKAKLTYIKQLTDLMISDEFLNEEH